MKVKNQKSKLKATVQKSKALSLLTCNFTRKNG